MTMKQQPQSQQRIGSQSSTRSQFGQQPPSEFGQRGIQGGQLPEGTQGYSEGATAATGQSAQPGIKGGMQAGGGQTTTQPMGRQQELRLDEALTNEMRVALHDLVQAANVTEWCAEQCIDAGPQMNECLRLCRDVADLAAMNVSFMTRDSAFGPDLIDVFIEAADACARECAQHAHGHCQECAEALSKAIQSSKQMLARFQGGGQQPMQQPMGGQFGQGSQGQVARSQPAQPQMSQQY